MSGFFKRHPKLKEAFAVAALLVCGGFGAAAAAAHHPAAASIFAGGAVVIAGALGEVLASQRLAAR